MKCLHRHSAIAFPLQFGVNMQVETRFGSRVMVCGDVLDSAEALLRAVNDSSFQITAADAQVCGCRNIALFNLNVPRRVTLFAAGDPPAHNRL